jgi:hypothetical protein
MPAKSSLLLFLGVLAVVLSACGGTTKAAGSSSPVSHNAQPFADVSSTATGASAQTARPGDHLRVDGDHDNDDEPHATAAVNDDVGLFKAYGKTASPADTRQITALVKAYYAAALAGDAAKACSLLHADLAAELAAQQVQPVHSGLGTCARSMSALLVQQHPQLVADEVPTMLVTSVHVKRDVGLAVLGFRRMPEGEIVLQHEGKTWKLDALFDSNLT